MISDTSDTLAIVLFSEIIAADQAIRLRLAKVLPKGMELSHFSVLHHLARYEGERTPAQLAQTFGVTRGAMTNTITKLDWAGYVHIRPDWDDARRKLVSVSPAGRVARDQAIAAIAPILADAIGEIDESNVRAVLPILRALRAKLNPL